MRRKVPGSVSVFLAYVLVFVLAVFFVLLEVARVWGLEQRSDEDVVMTGNSLLAEYDRELWERYQVLFLDASEGTEEVKIQAVEQRGLEFSAANLDVHGGTNGVVSSQTWNLYGLTPESFRLTGYGLATDQGGVALVQEAVRAMEAQYTDAMLEQLYQLLTKKEETRLPEVEVRETTTEVALTDNPIEQVEAMKGKDVLSLVTGDTAISEKKIEQLEPLATRQRNQGMGMSVQIHSGWKDKLLFRLYLKEHFGSYVNCKEDTSLEYEMEYLVVGKKSDRENLRGVVNRLLGVRELSNLQFLQSNVEKQEVILAAATALGAATLTPELIPVYKKGLMAAWAYVESVEDVRLLLQGEKVARVKTAAQWQTDLLHLGTTEGQKKPVEEGLDYQQYLQMFLWTMGDTVLAYRAMDLMEQTTGCRMDCQIHSLTGTIRYTGKAIFSSLITCGQRYPGQYLYEKKVESSYLER